MTNRPLNSGVPPEPFVVRLDGPTPSLPKVSFLDPRSIADWDQKVLHHPEATIFHSQGWAHTLSATYGHLLQYAVSESASAGRFDGVLPLAEARSWLTGRKGVSLPFTDTCRPLGSAPMADALVHQVVSRAREQRWKYVELRGVEPEHFGLKSSLGFFRHVLDLSATEDQLFSQLESSVRRAIRKAEASGLTVDTGKSIEDVRIYYALHCKTRQRHGLPPQPFRFFQNLHQHIIAPGNGTVVLARHGGVPVAGAVFLHFGVNGCYKFGASDEQFQNLRGNNLVIWRGILHSRTQGCKWLDFGRTSKGNEGLRRFKLGYGSKENEANYLRLDPRLMAAIVMADGTEGRLTKLYTKVPQSLSRCVGRFLYPHAT